MRGCLVHAASLVSGALLVLTTARGVLRKQVVSSSWQDTNRQQGQRCPSSLIRNMKPQEVQDAQVTGIQAFRGSIDIHTRVIGPFGLDLGQACAGRGCTN